MNKAPGADCTSCPLAKKPCAPTSGPSDSEVIIVSRSPGFYEAMEKKPFSGPSGKVLDHLLKMNGVERNDIRVTNVVLCAPDQGKVPPEAIKACSGRLKREVANASLVIAAGSEAVNSIIGTGSIDKYRGYRIERDGKTFVATNNPALVLRDDSTFPNLKKDFKRAFNPIPQPELPKVVLYRSEGEVNNYLTTLLRDYHFDRPVSCDIETRDWAINQHKLVATQFALTGNKATVLGEPGLLASSSLDLLKTLLESDRKFIYHNGKSDVKVFRRRYGINTRIDEDTLLLSYALDERSGGDDLVGVHGLEYLLMEELGWPKYETPAIKRFKKTGIVEDWAEFALYSGYDAAGTTQLFDILSPKVRKDPDLKRLYEEKLLRYAELTINMELHGCIYDIEGAANILEEEVYPELGNLTVDLREIADRPLLKPTSPTQVAALWYDDWMIAHDMQSRPDKKRSVDDSAREEILAGRFVVKTTTDRAPADVSRIKTKAGKFVKSYDRFQKLKKQEGTYLIGLIAKAELDPENRIYTELVLHGTNSGRLSSRKPNLQNITRTKEGLPDIRRLFKSSPGRQIVQADYSQAELRVITCVSGDKELTKVYEEDLDLHNIAAERFYGKDFTSEQRSRTKNMNFGVAYRQSAATFQEKHNIPEDEAQRFIDWWWKNFSGVAQWEKQIEVDIRSKGVLTTPFGRKRRFHLLTKENLQASYREGINFYPQSIASELTLSAALVIADEIDSNRAALFLSVHDSILADVEESYIDTYKTITAQAMEERAKEELGWTLPFKSDIGIGPTWAEAK